MAESAGRGAALDWKTSLQELTAALGLGVPEYRIEGTGPDHLKTFTAWVVVAGNRYGGSEGRSKKEAEQRAAESAWRELTEQAERDRAAAEQPEPADPAATAATADPAATAATAAATDPAAAERPAADPAAAERPAEAGLGRA